MEKGAAPLPPSCAVFTAHMPSISTRRVQGMCAAIAELLRTPQRGAALVTNWKQRGTT